MTNCEVNHRSVDPSNPGCIVRGYHTSDHCCLHTYLARPGVKRAEQATSTSSCTVCGAYFRDGDIWKHNVTGEHIFVGHTCADKYGMFAERKDWEIWHRMQTKLRSQAAKDKRFKVAALRFLESHPELAVAFRALPTEPPADRSARWRFNVLRDMEAKLNQYGSLSDKQVEFALKLAAEQAVPVAPKPEEVHVAAPVGRVTFTGTVVSTKVVDSDWSRYGVMKMVVKVATPEGVWLCWCTVPSGLAYDERGHELKGQVIEVTATLKPGKEAHFAFGSRPSARLVDAQQA